MDEKETICPLCGEHVSKCYCEVEQTLKGEVAELDDIMERDLMCYPDGTPYSEKGW